jgi:MFS transporter, DHA1 family, multidrug resistance protein
LTAFSATVGQEDLESGLAGSGGRWQINYGPLLLAQFVSAATFASVTPFLSLYLIELGESQASAIVWAGAISVGANVLQFVAVPMWGVLADRFGRNATVVRALVGAGLAIGSLVLARQAWHVFVNRLFQGVVSSPNAAILALASAILPAARLGAGMGVLQTAQFLGVSAGPLLGAFTISQVGYRGGFLIAGAMAMFNALAVLAFVREPARPSVAAANPPSTVETLSLGFRVARWRAALLATLGYQTAFSLSFLLLPLHINSVVGRGDSATVVAWAVAANSAGIALGAAALGWLSGRAGARRVTLAALLGAGLLTAPLSVSTTALEFVVLRFAVGFCLGGVLPSLRTAIGEAVRGPEDEANLGAVYGLSVSAQSAGSLLAAPLSSLIASLFGLPVMHFVSAAFLVGTATAYTATTGGQRVTEQGDSQPPASVVRRH